MPNKTELAKDGIENLINRDQFGPASKLPPILERAEMLKLKSQPVRRGIEALLAEARLYTVNGKGIYISDPTAHELRTEAI